MRGGRSWASLLRLSRPGSRLYASYCAVKCGKPSAEPTRRGDVPVIDVDRWFSAPRLFHDGRYPRSGRRRRGCRADLPPAAFAWFLDRRDRAAVLGSNEVPAQARASTPKRPAQRPRLAGRERHQSSRIVDAAAQRLVERYVHGAGGSIDDSHGRRTVHVGGTASNQQCQEGDADHARNCRAVGPEMPPGSSHVAIVARVRVRRKAPGVPHTRWRSCTLACASRTVGKSRLG